MILQKDPQHLIIKNPWEYRITDFRYKVSWAAYQESYTDLTLQKNDIVRRLRFYGPRDLQIEKGFPIPTRGMEILDVSSCQVENIGVRVSDFEASHGSITFWAKRVVDSDEIETG